MDLAALQQRIANRNAKLGGIGLGYAGLPVACVEISPSKFPDWRRQYGEENRHHAAIPRKYWLASWEREAILAHAAEHREEGHRRLTYIMLDADVVAASPSNVYRVLKEAEVLRKWANRSPNKGKGSLSPGQRIDTGILTSPTSASVGRSTTCARCWMATAATLCPGRSGSR